VKKESSPSEPPEASGFAQTTSSKDERAREEILHQGANEAGPNDSGDDEEDLEGRGEETQQRDDKKQDVEDLLSTLSEPLTERIFDAQTIETLEMEMLPEFFCGNSVKTPARYLRIRNFIIETWNKVRPKYLAKTAVRPGLRDCGDVNAIGRVHEFLERIGAINFGIDKPIRKRQSSKSKFRPPTLQAPNTSRKASNGQTSSSKVARGRTSAGGELELDKFVDGRRRRRVRSSKGEWVFEEDLEREENKTTDHTVTPIESLQEVYEDERLAAINQKWFAEDYTKSTAKRRLPRDKRADYYTQRDLYVEMEPGSYDPFRLVGCKKFTMSDPAPFHVVVSSNAMVSEATERL
jgi:hypothetical protein